MSEGDLPEADTVSASCAILAPQWEGLRAST